MFSSDNEYHRDEFRIYKCSQYRDWYGHVLPSIFLRQDEPSLGLVRHDPVLEFCCRKGSA